MENTTSHHFASDMTNTWNGELPMGGQGKQITACLDALGRLEAFFEGMGGDIYQNIQVEPNSTLWTGPKHFSTDKGKSLVAVQDALGQLNLFYVGNNGHIYQNVQTDPAINKWKGDEKWSEKGNGLVVVLDEEGLLNIFYIGSSDAIFHRRQADVDTNAWGEVIEFGGRFAKQLAVVSSGRSIQLFYIGKDGYIYRQKRTDVELDNWQNPPISFGVKANQLSAIVDNNGFTHIFYAGSNDQLYHNWQTDAATDTWMEQTPFGVDKGGQIVVGRDFSGLQTFFYAQNHDLQRNWEVTQDNEEDNDNWHGSVQIWKASPSYHLTKAKQIAVAANADARLQIFYVGTNDDIYTNWQTLPASGFTSSANQILWSGGEALLGVTVTIDITQDVIAAVDSGFHQGFTFQLNAYSPTGFKCVWQQYIVGIHGPYIGASVNNWPVGNNAIIQDNFHLHDMPNRTFPAGYRFIIALGNDQKNNITHATYTVIDNEGNTIANVTKNVLDLAGGHQSNIAPIIAFEVDLVGPYDSEQVILTSGAGTMTYQAGSPLIGLGVMAPAGTGQPDAGTGESANSVYTPVSTIPSTTQVQQFSVVLDEATV